MHIVAVCYDLKSGYRPFEEPEPYDHEALEQSYLSLFLHGENVGLRFILTSYRWYRRGCFSRGWTYDSALGWKRRVEFRPDFIFDRSPFKNGLITMKRSLSRRYPTLNPFWIEEICSDKIKTYRRLGTLMPRTVLIRTRSDLISALRMIGTEKVVMKPRYGSMGSGVMVMSRSKAARATVRGSMIMQQFIEGYPIRGMSRLSVFDLRVVVSDGRIVDAYYRISKKGIPIANCAAGGKVSVAKKLPLGLLRAVQAIDSKLQSHSPRLYSCDFIIDAHQRPWLIELNSRPSLFTMGEYASKKRQSQIEEGILGSILQKLSPPPIRSQG